MLIIFLVKYPEKKKILLKKIFHFIFTVQKDIPFYTARGEVGAPAERTI